MPKRHIYALWLAYVCIGAGIAPVAKADPAEHRLVNLSEFLRHRFEVPVPISIPVPVEYEAVDLREAPSGYSYWMMPSDAAASDTTGDLPANNGYMYGRFSFDVGFDAEQDMFLGAEDQQTRDRAKQFASKLRIERADICGNPVLLVRLRDKGSRKYVFAAYVAPNSDMNVIYIALRPKNNSKKIGDRFLDLIEAQSNDATVCESDAPS